MRTWYVKTAEVPEETLKENQVKFPNVLKSLSFAVKKRFHKVTVKEQDNHAIVVLPILKDEIEIKPSKIKKILENLNQTLLQYDVKKVAISRDLEKIPDFKESIVAKVLDGRQLFKFMALDTISEIVFRKKEEMQDQEVSILVNQKTEINLQTILLLARNVKMINIVTERITEFKFMEEYIKENIGMTIKISNNTKKALMRSHIIVNLDFNQDSLNRFNLPKYGVIINVSEKVRITKKGFSGIVVQYMETEIPNQYIEGFQKSKLLRFNAKNDSL